MARFAPGFCNNMYKGKFRLHEINAQNKLNQVFLRDKNMALSCDVFSCLLRGPKVLVRTESTFGSLSKQKINIQGNVEKEIDCFV